MHGLGDNLHQRAVIRELMKRGEVWLETPWPSVYHDLDIKLAPKRSILRTQAKNTTREAGKYHGNLPPANHRIAYSQDQVRRRGGFLQAMCANSGVPVGDFSMPVCDEWRKAAQDWLKARTDKPLMLYRPLVERTEWRGCAARNPDSGSYVALAKSVRDRFFVVSVADLEPDKEWAVSESFADLECHAGELPFEMLAGLSSLAGLVFCSPGFMLILAQAVGAKFCAVFGGHESARFYDHGAGLFIQPMNPCECFNKSHRCDKRIDMPRAFKRLEGYVNAAAS